MIHLSENSSGYWCAIGYSTRSGDNCPKMTFFFENCCGMFNVNSVPSSTLLRILTWPNTGFLDGQYLWSWPHPPAAVASMLSRKKLHPILRGLLCWGCCPVCTQAAGKGASPNPQLQGYKFQRGYSIFMQLPWKAHLTFHKYSRIFSMCLLSLSAT